MHNPLVVVINSNAERYLCVVLPDNVFVKLSLNFFGLEQVANVNILFFLPALGAGFFLLQYCIAKLDTFITNIYSVAGN